jgi:Ca2+-binding RTX toxin-like protein
MLHPGRPLSFQAYLGTWRRTGLRRRYLVGNDRANLLFVLGGPDLLIGGGGHDDLLGSGGDDELRGGSRADDLAGGKDDDVLRPGRGCDRVFGHDGRDTLYPRDGDRDRGFGGPGADRGRIDSGLDVVSSVESFF